MKEEKEDQCGWRGVSREDKDMRQGWKGGLGPDYTWHHGHLSGYYSKYNREPLENFKPKSNVIFFFLRGGGTCLKYNFGSFVGSRWASSEVVSVAQKDDGGLH